ncbi:hypothetical protein BH23THE1_BH23THE1_33950 [soil metagenome]
MCVDIGIQKGFKILFGKDESMDHIKLYNIIVIHRININWFIFLKEIINMFQIDAFLHRSL